MVLATALLPLEVLILKPHGGQLCRYPCAETVPRPMTRRWCHEALSHEAKEKEKADLVGALWKRWCLRMNRRWELKMDRIWLMHL